MSKPTYSNKIPIHINGTDVLHMHRLRGPLLPNSNLK